MYSRCLCGVSRKRIYTMNCTAIVIKIVTAEDHLPMADLVRGCLKHLLLMVILEKYLPFEIPSKVVVKVASEKAFLKTLLDSLGKVLLAFLNWILRWFSDVYLLRNFIADVL